MTQKPTDLELAKAIWDLTCLLGILPTREEKQHVCSAVSDLIDPILKEHGFDIYKREEFYGLPGVVDEASKRGYEEHLANKRK